jgi:methionyl-tRNA synthetase
VQTAEREGLSARALADRNSDRFRAMAGALAISNDDFIRTTEPRHYRASQAIWERMVAAGDIYLGAYEGWYSVRDEAFYGEEETSVGADGVRVGGQGTPVEWTKEETYFFRLSKYQDRLLAFYEQNPDFVGPDTRFNEVISFVKGGLADLSVSRTTFDWGVPVPGADGHVMYVWVDALTNYLTAAGFPDDSDPKWPFWPADLHVIGKDIVRFHAVYWPAFLMSAGIALPKRVYGHGFLFNRGEKMSKSLGNVVDPFAMVEAYGVDAMRYFLLREVAFGNDGSYSHEAIVARTNADLANDIGNLAQRSLSMIAKNCDGVLPTPGAFTPEDEAILGAAAGMLSVSREAMGRQQIHRWLEAVWAVVGEANRYFAGQAPWALRKTDPARMGTVLYVTAEVIRQAAILAQAAIPVGAPKLLDLLAVPEDARDFAALGTRLIPGTVLPVPQGVFPRYVEPEASA